MSRDTVKFTSSAGTEYVGEFAAFLNDLDSYEAAMYSDITDMKADPDCDHPHDPIYNQAVKVREALAFLLDNAELLAPPEEDNPEPYMGYSPGEDARPEPGAIPGEMFRA